MSQTDYVRVLTLTPGLREFTAPNSPDRNGDGRGSLEDINSHCPNVVFICCYKFDARGLTLYPCVSEPMRFKRSRLTCAHTVSSKATGSARGCRSVEGVLVLRMTGPAVLCSWTKACPHHSSSGAPRRGSRAASPEPPLALHPAWVQEPLAGEVPELEPRSLRLGVGGAAVRRPSSGLPPLRLASRVVSLATRRLARRVPIRWE